MPAFPSSGLDWLTLGSVALPHFLYAFIWVRPDLWKGLCGKRSLHTFAAFGLFWKVVQFAVAILWLSTARTDGQWFDWGLIPLPRLLAALILGTYGQALNFGVMYRLGEIGVYYGCKLGYYVPWVKGWPFNSVPHPQYLGSTLTVWAAAMLAWDQAPQGLLTLATFWSLCYAGSAYVEQYL